MARAWLYDGETAFRHGVEAERSGDDLLIRFEDGDTLPVARSRLVHVENRSGYAIYGRPDAPGWRLGIPEEAAAELDAVLPRPERYGRLIDRIGLVPALLIGLAVSAAVVVGAGKLPEWLAPHVPMAWEDRYGDTMVGDFGGKFCAGEGGQEALDKLAARLSPGAEALNIRIVDLDVANAAALPGGNIVIFEELLAEADGPDEVAGVLAHEIAHVRRRHVTQAMIRELGLGLVISAFGGNTGGNINSLLAAGYSRGAEREADADAIAMLRRAGISPLATAGFFDRLAAQEQKLGRLADGLSYISTHPMSSDRRELFRASAEKGRAYTPALGEDEWSALFNICFNDPARGK
jgi:Zn-dependent protease with chaperone function